MDAGLVETPTGFTIMNMGGASIHIIVRISLAGTLLMCLSGCNGSARPLSKGSSLGPAIIGEEGERVDGNDFGQIYTVTNIVEATTDIPEWTDAELPFAGPRRQIGQNFTDSQWPFKFTFTYPPNNYKLGEAHLVIVTARDSSDTEGIFVDGVMTGRPPSTNVSTTSTKVTHRHYVCSGTCSGGIAPTTPSNLYFMDWALTHYKVATPNSFDLNIAQLLDPTTVTPVDVVSDGVVRIVTADDSMVHDTAPTTQKPLLMLEGFTVSKTALSCTNSPSFKFLNTYIHNDGNSVGQAAFVGTVTTPVQSWATAAVGFRSVEFYFDAKLPRISSLDNLSVTKANLVVQVRRGTVGTSAIVVNGIAVTEAGFDRGQATAEVETYDDSSSATNYWASIVSGIPANDTAQTRTIDLISLLGATKIRELLAQGKLNVSLAGALGTVQGAAATSTRTYGVQVAGPELVLEGNYTTEICTVPNDPTSPLSDSSGAVGSCDLDQASPSVSSIQAASITSTSATIQWLSSEPSDSQVGFGISGTSTNTTLDSAMTSFHSVQLTGLQPYKYYQFVVKSRDACGNLTISGTKTFRTLR